MEILGIDIGSYGIKGCIVDTEKGEIISEYKSTPPLEDSTPHKVLAQMHHMVSNEFEWDGPVGCAFPAPVNNGIVLSARRIDKSWIDANAEQLFSDITDNPVTIINDTDATGLAEMHFGAGINQSGLTIVLTVGTGIGSSLFMDGKLVPNTELGLLEIDGTTVEKHASNKARKEENLRKKIWAKRLETVLEHFEKIFHPNLFILGGQLSKKAKKTFPYIKINTAFKAAEFQNEASIVGAAMVASNKGNEVFYR
ncbi:polyphosphate--glucose phosphotransferase [Fodinibius halophilus]|uniref:ROK family protein n=1 Tax=Fodinibius halophilus TaxID=1736908 RepID=A0A6M1SU46_9BACT|nr:ROK family protein [Fodinibius halophilus]NGP87478.1 ROK family protein [Fodinibius halophilus]